ncbi:MAG: hypothetical protein RXR18_03785 [Nitrososphaeria archaeon]
MKVPVFIKYSKLEDNCYCDKQEGIICDDFKDYVDVDTDDVQLDRTDLEDIVNEYLDDIADILMMDKRLLDRLLKKLNKNTM